VQREPKLTAVLFGQAQNETSVLMEQADAH
jgi:hypothetical protein